MNQRLSITTPLLGKVYNKDECAYNVDNIGFTTGTSSAAMAIVQDAGNRTDSIEEIASVAVGVINNPYKGMQVMPTSQTQTRKKPWPAKFRRLIFICLGCLSVIRALRQRNVLRPTSAGRGERTARLPLEKATKPPACLTGAHPTRAGGGGWERAYFP